ncbi:putative transcriptional regulator with HTH domain [metagenome]|uniref:Putative transcriptional regulator with HTH domain n=1 Tax=metagenome TaxID=256318 RepID=A0A2P2CIB6_9ZZZZ
MCNRPDGGYIVVGVDDHGRPAHDQPVVAVRDFDSASLRAKVARYVDAPIHIVAQPHVVGGRDIVLIYVHPNADGLPVPMSADGQYVTGKGKNETVFTVGEVLIREGTSNIRLRYAHWHTLLTRYRERLQAEARRDVDALVRTVVDGLQSTEAALRVPQVPLDSRMEPITLSRAVVGALEAPTPIRIEQFLNTTVAEMQSSKGPDQRELWARALNAIAIVASQAALYRRQDVFERAVDALQRAYTSTGRNDDVGGSRETAERSLDVVLRIFAIGALLVRRKEWTLLPALVLHPIRVSDHYVYGSWIRHGSVRAARAGLLQSDDGRERGGQLISLAHSFVAREPALRPDYSDETDISPIEEMSDGDWLLNSMCEFDLWWCLIAAANRPIDSGIGATFNPSCAAFHQYRAQPALDAAASDAAVRSNAFGGAPDSAIADALAAVVHIAVGQSHQYGGWWDGLDASPTVKDFVRTHGTGADVPGY